MLNLAIFYGGKSVEHDISIITAVLVMNNLNNKKYNFVPVYITHNNEWIVPKNFKSLNIYASKNIEGNKLVNGFFNKALIKKTRFGYKTFKKIDAVINCMHGLNGEDGTLAGLLELNDIPYVGSGVLASSVCMDKVIQKDVLKANGFPIVKYTWFYREEFSQNEQLLIEKIEASIGYPMVVKPANLGSSIGINLSKTREELIENIKIALNFDKKVIIEEQILNLREINCSLMGYNNNIDISVLEEPKNWKTFLNFDEKYLCKEENKKQIDVKLSGGLDEKIKSIGVEVFKLLGASGVIRIDYLLNDKTKELYVNEINTVPGSLANYLWKQKYNFPQLLDKLIENSLKEYKYKNENNYTFASSVLKSAFSCKHSPKCTK